MLSDFRNLWIGFQSTPFLWKGSLIGLKMIPSNFIGKHNDSPIEIGKKLRLGHLAEKFAIHDLGGNPLINIIDNNVQIFDGKQTIGELDCLLKHKDKYIHLEIVYKFYLYDPSIGLEVNRWIGPNRKDSLVEKLTKIKEKQLPLIFKGQTRQMLDGIGLNADDFDQQLYFKAQLFVPYGENNTKYSLINNACIKGGYISLNQLEFFSNHMFHIPEKLDWLTEPHNTVEWKLYNDFKIEVNELTKEKKSPLCWIKSPEGVLQKIFVTWW